MPFQWSEYLELAEFLVTQQNAPYSQKAARRSAVSRAYYSAFCSARDYAQAHHGFEPKGRPGDHVALREHFKNRKQGAIADGLQQLREWRNECDYDNEMPPGLDRRVSEAIESARKIEREF